MGKKQEAGSTAAEVIKMRGLLGRGGDRENMGWGMPRGKGDGYHEIP